MDHVARVYYIGHLQWSFVGLVKACLEYQNEVTSLSTQMKVCFNQVYWHDSAVALSSPIHQGNTSLKSLCIIRIKFPANLASIVVWDILYSMGTI